MKLVIVLVFAAALASCSTSKPTVETVARDTVALVPAKPRVIFGFTSSGHGQRPSDAMRLDSSGQMTYITRARISAEQFSAVTGMAFLEDQDYARLEAIVTRGRLTSIDSSDLGIKCPQGQGEMMSLVLRTTAMSRTVNLTFDECATDYNLLLEPQRAAFAELIDWFHTARNKYRPYKP